MCHTNHTPVQLSRQDTSACWKGRGEKARGPDTSGRGVPHVQSAAALSSKAGLSRPGSSVHTGRGAGVEFLSPGTVPKHSVSVGEVPE